MRLIRDERKPSFLLSSLLQQPCVCMPTELPTTTQGCQIRPRALQ